MNIGILTLAQLVFRNGSGKLSGCTRKAAGKASFERLAVVLDNGADRKVIGLFAAVTLKGVGGLPCFSYVSALVGFFVGCIDAVPRNGRGLFPADFNSAAVLGRGFNAGDLLRNGLKNIDL